MNLNKSFDFFDPTKCTDEIHIIGCGSVGSCIAEMLARYGLANFVLYDMDKVEEKNIVNQMFFAKQVGMEKVDAVEQIIKLINPDANVRKERFGYEDEMLSGYVFLCPDDIEVRKTFVNENEFNRNVKAVFDCRTSLLNAQMFAADWANRKQVENMKKSMAFTREEADTETPTSACGTILGVANTVRAVVNVVTANFINFVKDGNIVKKANVYPFNIDPEGYLS